MRRVMFMFVTCAAAVAMSARAEAADMSSPPLLPPPSIVPAPKIDTFATGWYLRGDVGYRYNRLSNATTSVTPDPTASHIDHAVAVGIGMGFKKSWFRIDATLDYALPFRYTGDTAIIAAEHTVLLETLTGLVNLYADLGTWSGITPYVGAGAGASLLRTSDFATATAVPPISSGFNVNWRFSWALMAGVSFGIGPVALDLGYRWLSLGDAASGVDMVGNRLTLENLVAQEIRLGMRLAL